MGRNVSIQLPSLQRTLKELGENIRLARLRRKYSQAMVAKRAGMSRPTVVAIERGDSGVTLGAYANVLHCLGLQESLALVASSDVLGRKLQDAQLAVKKRAPKRDYRDK
jgi:transcriptional regulator with XRE-family HTH domain